MDRVTVVSEIYVTGVTIPGTPYVSNSLTYFRLLGGTHTATINQKRLSTLPLVEKCVIVGANQNQTRVRLRDAVLLHKRCGISLPVTIFSYKNISYSIPNNSLSRQHTTYVYGHQFFLLSYISSNFFFHLSLLSFLNLLFVLMNNRSNVLGLSSLHRRSVD